MTSAAEVRAVRTQPIRRIMLSLHQGRCLAGCYARPAPAERSRGYGKGFLASDSSASEHSLHAVAVLRCCTPARQKSGRGAWTSWREAGFMGHPAPRRFAARLSADFVRSADRDDYLVREHAILEQREGGGREGHVGDDRCPLLIRTGGCSGQRSRAG